MSHNKRKPPDNGFSQRTSPLYCPLNLRIPLQSTSIGISYVEMLNETCIEPPHLHSCHEIYFCVDCEFSLVVGGKQHNLSPGEFVIVSPGVPHHTLYSPERKKTYFVMVFSIPPVEDDIDLHPLLTRINALSSELCCPGRCDIETVKPLLAKMEQEISSQNMGWLFLFRDYCLEFLMICLREVIPPFHVEHKELSNVNIAIEITKFMHNHYNQNITLDDAAKALFISTRQAQRIFKQFFNSSFTKMMNYYRMNYAKNYLMTTDYSVEKIAELVGLSSPQLLYNLFRTYEAQSIKEYRDKWSLGEPKE